jgi:hypothetical protein
MKNTAKTTKTRSVKSLRMTMEALEPRLLMSAAEDLKTELGSLDTAVDTWVATHVTAQANTKVDGLFGVVAGADWALKLSDRSISRSNTMENQSTEATTLSALKHSTFFFNLR